MENGRLYSLIILIVIGMLGFITASLESGGKGTGSATVPISAVNLTEQGTDYNMKPGRLKFEFNERLYAIQVRRINQESVDFLIMTLDMNKQEDITAYTLDDSFSLKSGEKREINIDKDGINDILLELNNIKPNSHSIKSAGFSIKKINAKKSEAILTNEEGSTEIVDPDEITENKIQEQVSESVIVLNQKSKEQSIFLDEIIDWFKGLFRWK